MTVLRNVLLLCLTWNLLAAAASRAGTTLTLSADIGPQSVAEALAAFGRQTGLQLIYVSTIAETHQSKGARAGLTAPEALTQLLDGTGLRFEFLNARTVRIYPAPPVVPTTVASLPVQHYAERRTASSALGLEEVVVTATRREEQANRVPISMAVWSKEAMEASGVKSMAEIGALTPGVEFDTFPDDPGVNTNISIRGVNGRNGTTVGVFLDDTLMPAPAAWGGDFGRAFPLVFDLDRVEVLRGPQGALLGEGTEGGAVRFITNQPSLTNFSGFTRAEVATTERGGASYEAGIAVGGPILANVLGFRVSAWQRSAGGYIDRVDPFTGATVEPNANSSVSESVTGALTIALGDTVRITPSITYQTTSSNDSSSFYTYLSNPGSGALRNGKLLRQPVDDTFYLGSLTLAAGLGKAELQAVTSYFDRRTAATVDATNNAGYGGWGNPLGPEYPVSYSNAIAARVEVKQAVFSQELRLASAERSAPVSWLVGAFYSRSHNRDAGGGDRVAIGIEEWGPTHGFDAFGADETQRAAFGQLGVRIAQNFGADAGLRIERAEHQSLFWGGDLLVPSYYPNLPSPPQYLQLKSAETTVVPKFVLSYQDEHNLWYATIARGYRMGGVNGVPPLTWAGIDCSVFPKSYAPDTVWSYEIGAKNGLLGGRLQLDTSVFHISWSKLQLPLVLDPANEPCVYLSNAANAVSNGFDFGVHALVTERVTGGLTIAYADAHYTQTARVDTPYVRGTVIVAKGEALGALPLVPSPWNVTASIDYRRVLASRISGSIRAEDVFRSRNPRSEENLRAEVTWPKFDLALFVDNALDSQPTVLLRNRCCSDTLFYATTFRPRTVGLSGKWQF